MHGTFSQAVFGCVTLKHPFFGVGVVDMALRQCFRATSGRPVECARVAALGAERPSAAGVSVASVEPPAHPVRSATKVMKKGEQYACLNMVTVLLCNGVVGARSNSGEVPRLRVVPCCRVYL